MTRRYGSPINMIDKVYVWYEYLLKIPIARSWQPRHFKQQTASDQFVEAPLPTDRLSGLVPSKAPAPPRPGPTDPHTARNDLKRTYVLLHLLILS